MRWEKVFISYDTHDDALVTRITDALTSVGLEPFKVPNHISVGSDLVGKVVDGINDSNCFVPILTENSIKSQWVNQEIGYAFSRRDKLAIFPVVQRGIQIKGFIHPIKENIQLNIENPEDAIYHLIFYLRGYINRNMSVVKKVNVKCRICTREYSIDLPSEEEIAFAVSEDRLVGTRCKGCGNQNNLSPKTFEIKNHLKIV